MIEFLTEYFIDLYFLAAISILAMYMSVAMICSTIVKCHRIKYLKREEK